VTVRQYGTVILTRPVSHVILTCVFVTLALLLIAFFAFFETTRKAPIQGMLVPTAGVIRVFPNQVGVIKEIRIKEGLHVREGDILFVVSSERGTSSLRSTETLISELLAQRRDSFHTELQQAKAQAGHRRAALQQRAQDLEGEIKRLDNQALMQKQRIALSEQTVARFAQLKVTNYISAAQLQEREAELLDQHQRLLEIERIRSATQRDLASTHGEELAVAVQALR
jgi:membrane fusion protein